MRMLKTSGGMTHGRGITDSTLTKWVHAQCVPVCDALEKFTGVHSDTSEQHKHLRSSTQARDKKDNDVFVQWLQAHPSFAGYQSDRLVSIATGVVADTSANCDNVVQIGKSAAKKLTIKSFTEIPLHRSDKVKRIGKKNSVSIHGKNTVVNPTLFFNRIPCVLESSTDMEQFLTYELAPQPPSLFLDSAMRKPTKSALGNLLKSFVFIQTNLPNTALVIYGGHLLQTVVWSQPSTYRAVYQCYVAYILKHCGTGTIVVFDGYTTVSTKSAEQLRRAKKATSSDIIFVENMQTTTSQTVFLANSHNKSRLIVMLNDVGIQTIQAPADADALIVSTALSVAETPKTVIVVGTDTGLLVMLVHLSAPNMDLYMLCSRNPFILHGINDIRTSIGDTREYMLVFKP